ncbi:MAG: decaprenyl-phosphate phosphoribosyltransferase [Anaerolineales bacterium]|nr:decaprenyl-phosphate phosphoribosyltransferase [Anaerolineales bacterium]
MWIDLLKTMRPRQWTKNVFFFAALAFDAKLFNPDYLLPCLAGFVLLCLTAGTVYIINDLVDIEKDRQHPVKCKRPLASGKLTPTTAMIALVIILITSQTLSYMLKTEFGMIMSGYLLLQICYSFVLKNIVFIDVLTIATGFVLRVGAGVELVDVQRFSPWLYVCMTLLALFMGFGKRRHELKLLKEDANNHRAILDDYTLPLLDQIIIIVVAATIIAYALYTFSAEGLPENHLMMLTIPFVLYGFFRYLYLIQVKDKGGVPDEILLGDPPFLLNCVLWAASVVAILYVV